MEQPKRGAHGDASGENLLAWIQSPTALQGADHFARRASLEAEEGKAFPFLSIRHARVSERATVISNC
jgi:hypothetical protein